MLGINFRRIVNTRLERIIVICIKYSPLKGNFENKQLATMISDPRSLLHQLVACSDTVNYVKDNFAQNLRVYTIIIRKLRAWRSVKINAYIYTDTYMLVN